MSVCFVKVSIVARAIAARLSDKPIQLLLENGPLIIICHTEFFGSEHEYLRR